MKHNKTHILILLDKSGSMLSFKDDTIGGINSFISEQKMLPGEIDVTLVTFSTTYHIIYSGPIENFPELNERNYRASGNTALLESVSKSMFDLGKRFADTKEEERPEKVMVAIITDGKENASQPQFTKERVKNEIKHQQDIYSWDFIYLGANQDSFAEAHNLNIGFGNTINFSATSGGFGNAYSSLNSVTSKLRTSKFKSKNLFADAGIDNTKTL